MRKFGHASGRGLSLFRRPSRHCSAPQSATRCFQFMKSLATMPSLFRPLRRREHPADAAPAKSLQDDKGSTMNTTGLVEAQAEAPGQGKSSLAAQVVMPTQIATQIAQDQETPLETLDEPIPDRSQQGLVDDGEAKRGPVDKPPTGKPKPPACKPKPPACKPKPAQTSPPQTSPHKEAPQTSPPETGSPPNQVGTRRERRERPPPWRLR